MQSARIYFSSPAFSSTEKIYERIQHNLNFRIKEITTLFQCLPTKAFKGTVASDFVGPFLACMVWPRKETSVQVFNFSVTYFPIFVVIFKVLKRLIPKYFGDFLESPRWIYKCGQRFSEISYFLLGDESPIHQYYWRHIYKFGGFFPIC